MDIARRAVGLVREAAPDAGRDQEVAVAFSINGDVDPSHGRETIRLLCRAFEEQPPDLILLETLSLARNGVAHVHAIDIDGAGVKNTLTNAFRNGVADRVSGATQDLYPWVPEER